MIRFSLHLSRIKFLIGQNQDIRIVLLIPIVDLCEVDRSSNTQGVALVYSHLVDILIGSGPEDVFIARSTGKEAHAHIPSMSECHLGT